MWIFLALVSAGLSASRRTGQKRLSMRLNAFTIGFLVQLLSLPLLTVALLWHGWFVNPIHLGRQFWLPLVGICIGFYPLNSYLTTQAIKHDELSNVLPIQSLWPVFSLLPAWVFLGQTPSLLAVLGIFLTVLGVYALSLKNKALHHPLQPFRENKSSRYMLFAVGLVTVAGILDTIAIRASDAVYFSFASSLGAMIAMAATLWLYKINELKSMSIKNDFLELGLIGSLQGGSYLSYLAAISLGPIAYVSSIRSSNILMGSILGIVLLNEKFTRAKMLSYALIATGILMLAIG